MSHQPLRDFFTPPAASVAVDDPWAFALAGDAAADSLAWTAWRGERHGSVALTPSLGSTGTSAAFSPATSRLDHLLDVDFETHLPDVNPNSHEFSDDVIDFLSDMPVVTPHTARSWWIPHGAGHEMGKPSHAVLPRDATDNFAGITPLVGTGVDGDAGASARADLLRGIGAGRDGFGDEAFTSTTARDQRGRLTGLGQELDALAPTRPLGSTPLPRPLPSWVPSPTTSARRHSTVTSRSTTLAPPPAASQQQHPAARRPTCPTCHQLLPRRPPRQLHRCDVPGCTARPFGEARGLARHREYVHAQPVTLPCGAVRKNRPDNVQRHVRKCEACRREADASRKAATVRGEGQS